MSGVDYDDHARFERPRKHTRPRTKDRPDYSALPTARVITVDRGRYRCLLDGLEVSAAKARGLGRKSVIVGDLVRLDGDVSGSAGTLARVVEVTERSTILRRTADDADPFERPMVANADQLVIVTALADPPPRPGMIDRILVAAFDAGLDPLLCLTKADLASPEEIIAAYAPLDVPIVVSAPGAPTDALHTRLADRVSVLVGHSGVGKSTLVNRLVPDALRAVGSVNEVTGRGRHTSTSAVAIPLPGHRGWLIDTPGVRSFGLSHVTSASLLGAFADLDDYTHDCPRACPHTSGAPECGLDAAVLAGELAEARLASFRRMLTVLLANEKSY